jgi:hypothetical protein
VPLTLSDTVAGVTATDTGTSVTVAVAVLLVSATDVAVTVTLDWFVTVAGAVYRPVVSIVPQAAPPAVQLTSHVTAVFGLPAMEALNCCVCAPPSVADCGDTEIVSGFNVTTAVPDLVLSTTEVAITVTVEVVVTTAGAVYRPAVSIVPHAAPPAVQLTDQVTAVFGLPVTVCVNCCVSDAISVVVPGDTATERGFSVTVALAVLLVSTVEIAVIVTTVVFTTTAGAV